MRIVVAILWFQLAVGAVGLWASFGYGHWAGTATEWWRHFEEEFNVIRKSQDYREPLPIRQLTYSDVIERHRSDARLRLQMAAYGLLLSAVVVICAGVLLVRVYQIQKHHEPERKNAEPEKGM